MQIPSSTAPAANTNPLTGGKSQQDVAASDKSFAALLNAGNDDPAAELRKITKHGMQSMWEWQIDQLKKKVADQVMQEQNLTADSIKSMPPQQRAEIENKIMKEVERRVKQMVGDEMAKKEKNPLGMDLSSGPDKTAPIGSTLDIAV